MIPSSFHKNVWFASYRTSKFFPQSKMQKKTCHFCNKKNRKTVITQVCLDIVRIFFYRFLFIFEPLQLCLTDVRGYNGRILSSENGLSWPSEKVYLIHNSTRRRFHVKCWSDEMCVLMASIECTPSCLDRISGCEENPNFLKTVNGP